MVLLYSFVARGTVVLAEHTDPTYEGNFRAVGLNFLERCPTGSSKFTFPSAGHTFNYLVDQGFTFLVVADDASGKETPYAYLDILRREFSESFKSQALLAAPMGLQKSLGERLAANMQHVTEHPEEVSKVKGLQRQVKEVQTIMENNIQIALARTERLEDLQARTDDLRASAGDFRRTNVALRRKMYWQNKKWWLIIFFLIVIVLLIIFLSICFSGGNCFK